MMSSYDLLQDTLRRIEAGEPPDVVLAELPEEEGGLVRLALQLQALPQPAQSQDVTAAQRQRLLTAARADKGAPGRGGNQGWPSAARPRWAWPAAAFAGAAALFVCVLLVSTLAGAAWWWTTRGPQVAQIPTPARAASEESTSAVAGPAATPGVAAAGLPEALDPQSGVLRELQGVVEVFAADGTWRSAQAGTALTAGQRLRTRELSSVTLAFYDGSQARLGPSTEVSVDALDAQKAGPRVVLLTQWLGESDHEVAHSAEAGSRYEVATPAGVGTAKGTSFHVLVTAALLVRFDVNEGAVGVTNASVTVVVGAGQSTVVQSGQPPQEPVFRVSGEGQVEEIGTTWRIAGQTFGVHAGTQIVGDPHVGDWVAVEGRLLAPEPGGLADESRVADRIVLLHRALESRFAFSGTVDAIAAGEWTVSGRVVRVDERTEIEAGIVLGDLVEVAGGIAPDGTLWAARIAKTTLNAFRFAGVVEAMAPEYWAVSGISVTINLSTSVEAGIQVGDVVLVAGQTLDDGTWLATSIRRAAPDPGARAFDFVGVVIGIDPWVVADVPLAIDDRTVIDEGIEIGNRVRVAGRVLADGTRLAESITQIDEGWRHHVQFVARVRGLDPWVIGGVTVTVDAKTKIIGDIEVGDLVLVKGSLLPDGTVVADKIVLVDERQGCVEARAVVRSVEPGQIVLLDGQVIALDPDIVIEGELKAGSVIVVRVCLNEAGEHVVVSITVIGQLGELPPTPTPAPAPTEPVGETGGKVAVCHHPPGNPRRAHTINVDRSSVPAHLAHGDTLGACP